MHYFKEKIGFSIFTYCIYLRRNCVKMKVYNLFFTQIAFIFLIFLCSCNGKLKRKEIQKPNLIEEGFESGTFPPLFKVSGNAPEIVKVSDAREGNYVMRSELNQSSEIPHRTEAAIPPDKNFYFEVGKEYWVGISIKLGEEFKDSVDWNDQGMTLQWHYKSERHPEVIGKQPLVIRYTDDGKVGVQCEVFVIQEPRKEVYMAYAEPDYGQWVDWVIHLKFDNTNGIFDVWRNGEQIVDFEGDNHQMEMIEGTYMKFGLYSSQYKRLKPGNFSRVVYHDALRIADSTGSYKLVAPKDRDTGIDNFK